MSVLIGPVFVLSAAVVLVAVLAPVLLVPRKNFSYAVLYDGLFEVAGGPDGAAKSEGEPEDGEAAVEQVRVIAVELRNSSGLNIVRSHYERPISVGFGDGARVLEAEVLDEEPPGIGATLRGLPERDPERVSLDPVLLNDGDVVLLEVVVAGSGGAGVELDGRIVGIRKMVEERRDAVAKTTLATANGVVAVLGIVLGALYQVFSPLLDVDIFGPSALGPVAGVVSGLIVADILLLVALYRRSRRVARVRRRILDRRVGEGSRAG